MSANTFPLRLELSTKAGRWLLLATFDGFDADQRGDVLETARRFVDAICTAGLRSAQLRVLDTGAPATVLAFYDSRRGWYPRKPEDLTP